MSETRPAIIHKGVPWRLSPSFRAHPVTLERRLVGYAWFPMEDLETFDGFPDDQDLPDIPAVPGTADPAPSQCWGGELSTDESCSPFEVCPD